ncbi:MAG: PqqD family protein [Chloroflexi bacterium]|nr:MAG: PqqD family protein [Chloroflexota bacterium]
MQTTQTQPPITLETVLSRRAEIIASPLSETEAVMLNMDKGFYYGVEDVAKFIWDALAAPLSVAALCDRIMAYYVDAERTACAQDALAFVGQLLEENLVYVHVNAPTA